LSLITERRRRSDLCAHAPLVGARTAAVAMRYGLSKKRREKRRSVSVFARVGPCPYQLSTGKVK
jgi:hypothetical protein